jgi:hypothetical protein
MNADLDPTHLGIARTIVLGGASKEDLLARLQDAEVKLNDHARALFAHEKFVTSPDVARVETRQLSVAQLGFAEGAVIDQVYDRAAALGLALCPLELGPHLRLQYLEQPECHNGFPATQHRAPPGSLTVASRELTSDDEIPKGFYLRRIEGVLWLRGYSSGADHLWSADDQFVFCRPPSATPEQST